MLAIEAARELPRRRGWRSCAVCRTGTINAKAAPREPSGHSGRLGSCSFLLGLGATRSLPLAISSRGMPERRSLRILIAEDDQAVARLYAEYARNRGHQVLIARDGAETLVTAATAMPDMIWLDVSMPKLDGRDVCQQLKANTKTKSIPILVVSALGGDQNVRDLFVELGAWDVLEKPVDLRIAFNKIERMAERAGLP
jgi:CheY-like chemotaxis protein